MDAVMTPEPAQSRARRGGGARWMTSGWRVRGRGLPDDAQAESGWMQSDTLSEARVDFRALNWKFGDVQKWVRDNWQSYGTFVRGHHGGVTLHRPGARNGT